MYNELKRWCGEQEVYRIKNSNGWIEVSFWVSKENYLEAYWNLNDEVIENFPEDMVDCFVKKETPNELNIVVRLNEAEIGDDLELMLEVLNNVDEHVNSYLRFQ